MTGEPCRAQDIMKMKIQVPVVDVEYHECRMHEGLGHVVQLIPVETAIDLQSVLFQFEPEGGLESKGSHLRNSLSHTVSNHTRRAVIY